MYETLLTLSFYWPRSDITSTSPPNGNGFLPGSWSSTNSSLTGYEIEVVEIRVKEGELDDMISY